MIETGYFRRSTVPMIGAGGRGGIVTPAGSTQAFDGGRPDGAARIFNTGWGDGQRMGKTPESCVSIWRTVSTTVPAQPAVLGDDNAGCVQPAGSHAPTMPVLLIRRRCGRAILVDPRSALPLTRRLPKCDTPRRLTGQGTWAPISPTRQGCFI